MKYLCLLHLSESEGPAPGTPDYPELVAANIALVGEMTRAGVLVDSAPLHPTRSATTIRVREDDTLMTDGPYAELKEQLGGEDPGRPQWRGGGQTGGRREATGLSADLDELFRAHWWPAVATVTRLVGDLEAAEDAVQEACALALVQWRDGGVPGNPGSWLIGVARHKALDWQRREAKRARKEEAAVREHRSGPPAERVASIEDDQQALVFLCCHPALDLSVRVALTLRAVCGLGTAEIAAAFLTPEPTMAQRLVRARRKIREAGIPFRVPAPDALAERLAGVLRVVYLVFTGGHRAATGDELVRAELCDEAIRLARALAALLPDEPEVAGLLALLLLVDARRAARLDASGRLVLLEDQDRTLWDRPKIEEGAALLDRVLRLGRPG